MYDLQPAQQWRIQNAVHVSNKLAAQNMKFKIPE